MGQVRVRSRARFPLSYSVLCGSLVALVAGALIWQRQVLREDDNAERESDGPNIGYFEILRKKGADAVPELIQWLETGNEAERRNAAISIAYLQYDARDAWDALAANLDHRSPQVRDTSLAALYQIGRDLSPIVGSAARLLGDDDEEVRKSATKVLRRIGPPASAYVLPLVVHPRAETRLAAGRILLDANIFGPEFEPVFTEIYRDEAAGIAPPLLATPAPLDPWNATEVRESHWHWEPQPGIPAPDFDCLAFGALARRYLNHESAHVRRGAREILQTMGPGTLPAVIDLFAGTADETLRFLMHLVSHFDRIDPATVEHSRRHLENVEVSSAVRFDSLALIIASGTASADDYRQALQPESPICPGILQALARDPGRAKDLLPEVLALAEENPHRFQGPALRILETQESLPKSAISFVRGLLRDGLPYARLTAVKILSRGAIDRTELETSLREAVIRNDVDVPTAIGALLELAPQIAPEVVRELSNELVSASESRRKRAFVTLAALGPSAAAALPEIRQPLEFADWNWQSLSLLAIAGIGPEAAPTVTRLAKLLDEVGDDAEDDYGFHPQAGQSHDKFLVSSLLRRVHPSPIAIPRLIEQFSQPVSPSSRTNLVLAALERMEGAAVTATRSVTRQLDVHEARPVPVPFGHSAGWRKRRCALLQTLARISPDDRAVRERLQTNLEDPFPEVRLWSALLLLDRNDSVDRCLSLLEALLVPLSTTPSALLPLRLPSGLSELAAERLGRLGSRAEPALDSLMGAVRQKHNESLSVTALQGLLAIITDLESSHAEPDSAWEQRVIPTLIDTLRDDRIRVRWLALEALERLARHARNDLPRLRSEAGDWHHTLPDERHELSLSYDELSGRSGVSLYVPRKPTVRDRLLRLISGIEDAP